MNILLHPKEPGRLAALVTLTHPRSEARGEWGWQKGAGTQPAKGCRRLMSDTKRRPFTGSMLRFCLCPASPLATLRDETGLGVR